MNLGEIVGYANLKLGKDYQGGYISPDQLNSYILEAVNSEMINRFLRVYENNRVITDDIRPFIVTLGDNAIPALSIDSYGYGELPDDYIGYTDVRVNTYVQDSCGTAEAKPRMVEMINRDRFNYRVTTSVLKPRFTDPIGTIQNDKVYIQPASYPSCVFSYVRKPVKAYFDYDIVNDDVVYLPPGQTHANNSVEPQGSPSLSVEFEWPEQVHEELADMIVKYYATNFRSEFNMQTLDLQKPA